ncbi:hypothetical protein G4B88_024591 [Cannabis sativa]|uniref:Tyrosine decarboxylase n=1 Tax=Cannabis sativa TaxID=3483 RepID=A0A7J6GY26_CANSA|nr:hypothetical protein G4B88_024591 [Cannabis sativa]
MENGLLKENGLKPMDSEQLREYGHKMVDFIADYYKSIENFPVLSQVQPGYLHELIPDSAPIHPDSIQHVFDGEILHLDIQNKILPGVTHWQSPNFFAYYPANSSIAGFIGEMLSSGQGGGVIQGTASEAVLVVLLAARDKFLGKFGKNALGKLVVYASDQTHSALQKACQIGGIHPENCRLLRTDSSTNYAISPAALSEAISTDVANGLIPFFLCATVGTTSSTAVDPLTDLAKITKSYGIWLHIDAAYAGSACICPEYRHYIDGVEEADSFNMNAHKWLLTNFDCSALWIKASQANLVVDYKDWQIPLGRRFRSLKLWMVLRLYGLENLQSYIRNHINLAKHFEDLVVQDSRFEMVTPRIFSLVCFRVLPSSKDEGLANKLNHELLNAVNSSGKAFMSHTVLSGKYVLRLAVGAPLTEERHVNLAWNVIQEKASALLSTT